MRRGLVDHQAKASGLSPGSLVHIGERRRDVQRITAIEYDDEAYSARDLADLKSWRAFPERDTIRWVNVDGIHDSDAIAAIGQEFALHPLVLEDIMNAGQRPKLEEYDDCIFIVLKMLDYDEKQEQIVVEHVSIVLGKTFVLTFQERHGDVFDGVRERLGKNLGRIRKQKADYLAYRLIDAIVDHYFVALEAMGDLVEKVEDDVADDPTTADVHMLHTLRRETLFLRKAIWPARELLGSLARLEDDPLVSQGTLVYLRDVYDHILQVAETLETQRDILASMLDVYHSALSNRMNEVMKILAIISTIFIPLSFIAGVYGMNFHHMPELSWWFGYPLVLGLMAAVFFGFVIYFKKKGWY